LKSPGGARYNGGAVPGWFFELPREGSCWGRLAGRRAADWEGRVQWGRARAAGCKEVPRVFGAGAGVHRLRGFALHDAECSEGSMKTPKARDKRKKRAPDPLEEAGRVLADAARRERSGSRPNESEIVVGLKSLVAVCRQISSIVELGPLLTEIVGDILDLSDTERGFVMLREEDGRLGFVLGRSRDGRDLDAEDFRISMSTAEGVASTGSPVYATGPDAMRALENKKSVLDLGLKTIICVPLRAATGLQGVLYADSRSEVAEISTVKVEIVNAFAEQAAVAIENAKQYNSLERSKRELERECDRLRREMKRSAGLGRIVGRCDAMIALFDVIRTVAPTQTTVLIEGETGTGKELVARTLHEMSTRKGAPFIAVNCGALPEGTLESELFGHKRGAFTGASEDRAGLFETADSGTLFLDEISEMSPHLQVKLLRAIQDGEITRVGESKPRRVDVRVISATNRDLEREMEKGNFRPDLYYRLNVVQLKIPPLRERGNDIILLAQHFLELAADAMGRGPRALSPEAADVLLEYSWPGNVRELENMMERAVALGPHARTVTPDLLPSKVTGQVEEPAASGGSLKEQMELYERRILVKALADNDGNVARAAGALGVSKQHVYNMMRKFGIRRG